MELKTYALGVGVRLIFYMCPWCPWQKNLMKGYKNRKCLFIDIEKNINKWIINIICVRYWLFVGSQHSTARTQLSSLKAIRSIIWKLRLPIVDHKFLHREEGFVAHVGVFVAEEVHHTLLTAQLLDCSAVIRSTIWNFGFVINL